MTRAIDDDTARWELHEHTEQDHRDLRLEADDEVIVVRASWATAPESLRAQFGLSARHSVVNVLLPDEARELQRWLTAVIASWDEVPSTTCAARRAPHSREG